jgi:hypothetical protein
LNREKKVGSGRDRGEKEQDGEGDESPERGRIFLPKERRDKNGDAGSQEPDKEDSREDRGDIEGVGQREIHNRLEFTGKEDLDDIGPQEIDHAEKGRTETSPVPSPNQSVGCDGDDDEFCEEDEEQKKGCGFHAGEEEPALPSLRSWPKKEPIVKKQSGGEGDPHGLGRTGKHEEDESRQIEDDLAPGFGDPPLGVPHQEGEEVESPEQHVFPAGEPGDRFHVKGVDGEDQ